MKASELIIKLQAQIDQHGDLPVCTHFEHYVELCEPPVLHDGSFWDDETVSQYVGKYIAVSGWPTAAS